MNLLRATAAAAIALAVVCTIAVASPVAAADSEQTIEFVADQAAEVINPERGFFTEVDPFDLAHAAEFGAAKGHGHALIHGVLDLSAFKDGGQYLFRASLSST